MSTDSLAATDLPAVSGRWPLKIASVVALVALADWLFFRRSIGISLVVFVAALAAAIVLAGPARADRRHLLVATAVLLTTLLPVIEALNLLSFLICAIGMVTFAIVATRRAEAGLYDRATAGLWLVVVGPVQIFADVSRAWASRGGSTTAAVNAVLAWTLPILLGAVFVALFVSANPLIESWFADLSFRNTVGRLDLARVLFWLFVVVATWPFIAMTRQRIDEVKGFAPTLEPSPSAVPPWLFNDAVVVRCLILFNLLFAVQTVMDVNYLWRGAELPNGMTYASYAHRGAYPLIVTALLAAAFVIAAMRPGSAAERSPLMRTLVFVWTAQNVLLVVSAMLRLELYVETYSLTYLRVAAFIWMLLVAAGLVLIVVRILLHRSNRWLVAANLASLALALYGTSLVNLPYVIAKYNIAHSREVTGSGATLDLHYLAGLGPQAIPALDRYLARPLVYPREYLHLQRLAHGRSHLQTMEDWRGWSFRGRRLQRYLEKRPTPPLPEGAPGMGK